MSEYYKPMTLKQNKIPGPSQWCHAIATFHIQIIIGYVCVRTYVCACVCACVCVCYKCMFDRLLEVIIA